MRLMNSIMVGGLTGCLLAGALSACASAPEPLPQQRVSYAGLDLNSPVGARILLHRLEAAAAQVCGGEVERDLGQRQLFRECFATALADGVRQVNHRELSDLYAGRYALAPTTAMAH